MTSSQTDDFADRLAAAVERAAPSVLGVERRRGFGTTVVVWSSSGLLLGASHALVGDSGDLVLPDGERRPAEVIGRDAGTDIALLRADPAGLIPADFRPLDGLRVGHPVLALGRPGQAIRASLRIIGVIGPEVRTPSGGRLDRYVESDRGLPRGFSGGPLIDLDGRAIGINTSGLLRGADLVLPTATLERVVAELEAHGSVRRGFLGVAVQRLRLPARLRAELGRSAAVLVISVEEGSPAERAELHIGDVLLDLDGEPLRSPDELRAFLHERRGQRVAGRALRAGAIIDLEVEIGER